MDIGSSHIQFYLGNDDFAEAERKCNDPMTALEYRCPDNSFQHGNCQYPSVVIEISHPQKRSALERLAIDYIHGTNGNVEVVIGLDIEYQGSQKATMSVWVPKIRSETFVVEQTIVAMVCMRVINHILIFFTAVNEATIS